MVGTTYQADTLVIARSRYQPKCTSERFAAFDGSLAVFARVVLHGTFAHLL
jgi:hypothetical protein